MSSCHWSCAVVTGGTDTCIVATGGTSSGSPEALLAFSVASPDGEKSACIGAECRMCLGACMRLRAPGLIGLFGLSRKGLEGLEVRGRCAIEARCLKEGSVELRVNDEICMCPGSLEPLVPLKWLEEVSAQGLLCEEVRSSFGLLDVPLLRGKGDGEWARAESFVEA